MKMVSSEKHSLGGLIAKEIYKVEEMLYVEAGDVIVGKILVNSDKSGKEDLSDTSLVIKKGEEGYVDRIFTSITQNGYKIGKSCN